MRLLRNGLLALGIGLGTTGCFDKDKLTGNVLTLELIARKDYKPVTYTDGIFRFPKDTKFQIPAKLEVVYGNAGNHKSYLFFKKQKDKKESKCEYRGGSSQSEPKGQNELDKAKFYRLVKCDDGMKAEDIATAQDLRLRVDHGGNSKDAKYVIAKTVIVYEGTATPTPSPSPTPRVTPTAVPTATPTVAPTASPTPDIFAGLPPDPGDAGRATILGIDSDRDGVRDDVQRWIQQTAPNSKPVRNALKQYAATAQQLYGAIGNDAEIARLVQESSYASGCAMYVMDEVESRADTLVVLNNLRAFNLNTYLRMKAEEDISRAVSGKLIRRAPISDRRSFCKFNPQER